MSKLDNGGPAFARPAGDYNGSRYGNGSQDGMTLRDYFAAKAMQGLLGMRTGEQLRATFGDKESDPTPADLLAVHAYAIADAMLKAREA